MVAGYVDVKGGRIDPAEVYAHEFQLGPVFCGDGGGSRCKLDGFGIYRIQAVVFAFCGGGIVEWASALVLAFVQGHAVVVGVASSIDIGGACFIEVGFENEVVVGGDLGDVQFRGYIVQLPPN